ncbi:DUF4258 domain-containing protein [Thiocapsa sp. UBA6158]|jgi:hypothetical protein|uniref:DUF4258 domain-containing protein n=1 Tax=Thiocapsa sp. UBA6158 TaxID=1947692 RepID=UPI0025EC03F6|nr:DUF4258 domain-containing protein [Thiocapsa sp. UBA6158]
MDYALTDHARKRCIRRGIRADWIRQALEQHQHVESDAVDETLVHVLYPVPERGFRILRVIYNETLEPVTVVTAYFDDGEIRL